MTKPSRAPVASKRSKKALVEPSTDLASPPPVASDQNAEANTAASGGGGSGSAAPASIIGGDAPRLEMHKMPALGRIVVVVGRPIGEPAPDGHHGQHMTAIVTRVRGPNVVDLTVFPPGAPSQPLQSVPYGTMPGGWVWPHEIAEA